MALFGLLACLAGGCVTVDSRNYGVALDAANRPQPAGTPVPLLVSASEAPSYSSPYMGLVEVTFENNTPVWKQVDQVALDFGSPANNQSVTIVSGEDVDTWERAVTIRNAIQRNLARQIPAATAIEALGVDAGDALGAWVGHHHQPAIPEGGAPSTAGAPQARAVATQRSYPDQHLLSTPFRVPPGLFTKRWILLATPATPLGDACISAMILSYQTSDRETGRVVLRFKVLGSDWQAQACAPTPPPQRSSFPGHQG